MTTFKVGGPVNQSIQQIQEKAVETAASTSVGSMLLSWLPIVTDVLQLVATVVAIASAVMAYRWHRQKLKTLRGNDEDKGSTQR